MSEQIINLIQTLSPTQSLDSGAGFFPDAPGVTLTDGTIMYTWRDDATQDDPAGTGNFDPFLSIQKIGSGTATNFYNGSTHGTLDAIIAAENRTSLLKMDSVPVVNINGTEYLEFRLDINEIGGNKSAISIESFKIFGSNSATETGSGLTPLYSIDTNEVNTTVNLWDDNNGSGRSDVVMLVPKSYFDSNPEYLYFETSFTGGDGGFEEFSIYVLQQVDAPLVGITKTADVFNADASDDLDDIADAAGDVIRYTVTVANTGNVTLDPVVVDPFVNLTNDANEDGVIDGDTDDNGRLDVGESWVYTGQHVVTQAELDSRGNYDSIDPGTVNGDVIRNVVSVTTTQGADNETFADTLIDYDPRINILKTADVFNADASDDVDNIVDAAGDVIKYTITAENIGNITLTNPVLVDPLVADLDNDLDNDGQIDGDENDDGKLDVGETWTWTASYAVTQADIDARGNYDTPLDTDEINDDIIRNEVGVAVDEGISDDAFVNTVMIYDPLVGNTKTADVFNADASDDLDDIADAAGDVIRYTVTVANTGNVTLDPVVVDPFVNLTNDANEDGVIDGDTDDNGRLDVGESWVYTGQHVVTQAELDSRGNYDSIDPGTVNDDVIRNVVSVTTTQGADNETFADTLIDYDPRINILKTADVFNADASDDVDNIVDAAGDVIKYTITAENIGNITLTNPVLVDPLVADLDNDLDNDGQIDGDENDNGKLDVGETWTWTASYAVTQADIDARGNYDTPLDTDEINDDIIRNEVGVAVDEGISDDAFVNTVMIYDPLVGITKTADVFNADASDDLDDIADAAGDVIRYTVTVANTGNVTLDPVVVDPFVNLTNDANEDGVIDGDTDDNGRLDVGESWVYTGQHVVTQAELDSRGNYDSIDPGTVNDDVIRNVVSVTTTQGADNETFADTLIDYDPRINILKTADVFNADASDDVDNIVDAAGDVIKYTITAENIGNITLTNPVLVDPLVADLDNDLDNDGQIDGDENDNGKLDVGETWTWTASYAVTQADIDARGNYDTPLDTDEINDDIIRNEVGVVTAEGAEDDTFVDTEIAIDAALMITKLDDVWNADNTDDLDDVIDSQGDVIRYSINVKNVGNISLTNPILVDPLLASLDNDLDKDGVIDGDINDNERLDVNETWTWSGSYVVSQSDMDSHGNYDSESDMDEINDDVIRNDVSITTDQGASGDTYALTTLLYDPDLAITKTADVEFVDEAGDRIVYTIAVKNDGNITLDGLTVEDDMLAGSLTNDADEDGIIDGDENDNGKLDVGETWLWTGEYMVTEDDIQAAMMSSGPYTIDNTAYADSNQTGEEDASEMVGVQVHFEGLSHGYWKNHPSDWDGLASSTSFEEFFFGSQQSSLQWLVKNGGGIKPKFASKNDVTFSQALELTGGNEAALAREAVAAILNIRDEDVTYRFTEMQVKEWVTEALTGQAVDLNNDGINEFAAGMAAINGVKDLLDMNNNLELV